ncbi:porin family protein [Porphyromonas loveana]|uniref:porin family protein n=1 Tax=Porphyromonas loveana TaxID=1884669 RepID=UPI0035A00C01
MKRFVLVAAALLASATMSVAQNRPTFRVDANLSVSNQDSKRNDFTYNTVPNVGVRLGVGAEFQLGSKGFYLAPGLNYSMKGSITKWNRDGINIEPSYIKEESTRLHYLQLPINIGYRFALSDDFAISFEVGPYAAYGFSGTHIQKNSLNDGYHTQVFGDIIGGPSKTRWDVGAGLGVALHYKRTYLQAGYEHGFIDMVRGGAYQPPLSEETLHKTIYNRSFFVGLGYRF